MRALPHDVADDEQLHRRVHPGFLKPDGTVSSAAFNDESMSVDRATYWCIEHTMRRPETQDYCLGFSLARVETSDCRALAQDVREDPILLNPAHALVKGRKTRATCKALARMADVIVEPLPANQHGAQARLEERIRDHMVAEHPAAESDASADA